MLQASGDAYAYDATRVGVSGRGGRTERAQHGESSGEVLEGVRLGPATGHVEQPSQQNHR